jgi:hypothetical protein
LLQLPWANGAGLDRFDATHGTFTVNLEAGGHLYFRGNRWPLSGDARAKALRHFGEDLRDFRRTRPLAVIRLRVDHRTPWRDVRDVVNVAVRPDLGLERISLAGRTTDRIVLGEARIDGDVVPASRPAPHARTLVDVRTRAGEVRIDVGDEPFRFPGGDPYAPGPSLELANARWEEVSAALSRAKAAGADGTDLRISGHVPWAHVTQTLASLLRAGLADVAIEEGPRLSLSTPVERAGIANGNGPRDWPLGISIGLGAGIAVAVFALGALTGRRRARRPPPRGPGPDPSDSAGIA